MEFVINEFDTVIFILIAVGSAIGAIWKAYQVRGLNGALFEARSVCEKLIKGGNMSNVYMSDGVKHFLLEGLSPEDKILASKTVEENEANGIFEYRIDLSNRWFIIKNGQIAGSAVKKA